MKSKILVVHGWMHSAERYKQLKKSIEKQGRYEVTLYELPGFGDTPPQCYRNLLQYYTKKLEQVLKDGEYEYAIGHSMGGNVLLRAMAGKQLKTKLILLSPEYCGIALLKPFIVFLPIMPLGLTILKKVNCSFTTFLIKCTALLTVNRWEQIDDQIVKDARKASPVVATNAMMELVWDSWRISSRQWKSGTVSIIIGENDRIISRKKIELLRKDIKSSRLYCIDGIGHTSVVEAFDKLLDGVMKIINCKRMMKNEIKTK